MWCSSVDAIEYVDETTIFGSNDVVFVNKKGVKLIKHFNSPFLAKKFVRKCEKGKSVRVIWKGGSV